MILEEIKRIINNAPPWADGGKARIVFEVSESCDRLFGPGDKVKLDIAGVRFDAEKGITEIACEACE